ncbi:MAG: hypothetical protein HGA37_11610 [Lentimicrobium sp.]|nr:hypothetical protein [Lentimicrobium sp.]
MERWKDGRMEGWKDGKMEGWKDARLNTILSVPLRILTRTRRLPESFYFWG